MRSHLQPLLQFLLPVVYYIPQFNTRIVNFFFFPSLVVLRSCQFSPLPFSISTSVVSSYLLALVFHLYYCPLLLIWFSFLVLASVTLISLSSTSLSLPFPPLIPSPLLMLTRFSASLRFAFIITSLYVERPLLLCCRLWYHNLAGLKEGNPMGQRDKLSDNNGTMSHWQPVSPTLYGLSPMGGVLLDKQSSLIDVLGFEVLGDEVGLLKWRSMW